MVLVQVLMFLFLFMGYVPQFFTMTLIKPLLAVLTN